MVRAAQRAGLIHRWRGSGEGRWEDGSSMSDLGEASADAGRDRMSLGRALAIPLGLALLMGLGAGTLQAHAGRLALAVPELALSLIGAGVVGLLLGLVARLLLRGWMGALRVLLALAGLLGWLVASEGTYALWSGRPLLGYVANADDWVEGGQLAVGLLSLAAVALVGRRSRGAAPLPWLARREEASDPAAGRPIHWGLAFNLGVAILLGVGGGLLRADAGDLAVPAPPLAVTLIAAGGAGLCLGLAALFTLWERSEALRLAVVLTALVTWLVAAEATYAAVTGQRPLRYLAGADNWVEMGQLAIGLLGAVVGGVGRRRGEEAAAVPARETTFRLPIPIPRRAPAAPRSRVTGQVEDRCPYCLQPIEPGDPRGVVVCEICGTPHHADCWEAAGGKCQMPHLVA